ncbi:MAG: acetate/propionate family kinase, partial [Rhodospirillales bacterium]|nr:acetate/propionate family kinase [Rhodospirillales bacterium]
QVAVFDTAFHQSMPRYAYRYALSEALYKQHRIRRYGFHGTSHHYVSKRAAHLLDRPLDELRLITLHLGNGASAAAVSGGRSIDTSMGMTPLEGLVMGTRSGDLDPSVPAFIARETGRDAAQIDALLNKESGLLGICGSGDMRDVLARRSEGDANAALAIDLYCYRIRKYIGAYFVVLGGVDALVFTGGIGENAAPIRTQICTGLECLGVTIDAALNEERSTSQRFIQCSQSDVALLIIPTDEEFEIAMQTMAAISRD